MRAEQRSKLQASKQRSGTLSRRRRDGSNAAAALKVLCAKKRRASEEDEQGKRGVDGARSRPGPTTARALRARTKARAPGPAGPGPRQHGSILQKIHPTRGSRWLSQTG
ncbi:unnamed protein product [Sphagnum jensenii]|uniref:Uncharacterized protein n=1 Tax=Sphagnum jensenii TaxID=128206 RepID=A0ABP1ASI9_9BRYO